MPNTSPIFSGTPDVQVGGAVLGPTAVTAQDGTGNLALIFQAGANGSWIDRVTLKPAGSPAATVVRVFICLTPGAFTSGTTNTATNTSMITEFTLQSVTLSQVAAQTDVNLPIRSAIPSGAKLLIAFGTSTGSAGTGWAATTWGGDY